jgi:DNA-binding NarL/FixJ family response regulator
MILEAEEGLTVVGEAGDGAEAISLAHSCKPDVRVLVLTTFDVDEYAFGAPRAGASGFLLKDVRPAELVAAVRTVAA